MSLPHPDPNDPLWLLRFLGLAPADATATARKGPQRLPQRTIEAAKGYSIPLPAGDAQELNPVHRTTPLDVADALTGVRTAAKLGYGLGQAIHESNLGGAVGSALAAAPMMLPGEKLAAKFAGKLISKAIPSAADRFAILTAENAGGHAMSSTENAVRNAALEKELTDRGYSFTPVKGRYRDNTTNEILKENSYLIHNLGEREAKLIAKRYGQNGVITHNGYHDLVSNELFPSKGINAAQDLPYTQLPGGKKFALDIDWGSGQKPAINALPVPKNANPEVQRIAEEYRTQAGVNGRQLPPVKAVDPDKARLMAQTYEALKSAPDSPEVKQAYDQLTREVDAQFNAIKRAGYRIDFTDADPYKNSKEMMDDLAKNRTLRVLKTNAESAHPLLTPEQNDKFRAVHDFFGHAQSGYQFGPRGEEGAFRDHSSMFGDVARRVMATETRGQNSWVNFGPGAELPVGERPFAQQKAALWPEGLLGDYGEMPKYEKLTSAAVRAPDGSIYSGPTHSMAYLDAVDKGAWKSMADVPWRMSDNEGFATNLRSFVSRDEAANIADAAMQYKGGRRIAGRAISEDLRLAPPTAPTVITKPNSGNVFDVSKLGLVLPPGVTTERPPVRYPTERANLDPLKGMQRRFREVYTPNAIKALSENPQAAGWYDMSQVRDAMQNEAEDGADAFRKFMLFMGPTSSGTKVPENLRHASYFSYLLRNGLLNREALEQGTLDLPKGYANRRQASVNSGIAKILDTGDLDPLTQPKTYRYAHGLLGDSWGGAALDMHVGRQVGHAGLLGDDAGKFTVSGRGFPTPSFTPGDPRISTSPPDLHYPVIEDMLIPEAEKLGVTPMQYQALGWTGGAKQTGVADPRTLLEIFNDKLRSTAARYGYSSPLEAFRAFAKGQTPLYALPFAGGLLGPVTDDQKR